ncbi:unnamed protein product [Ceutorhynchus assimilis]|uniref:Uncharacterized protein n=1 Tax=Ceutorhynchus assimilis TaxID=467358 RepID=A0A9N9QJT5_9CUCU|nr:unnamed protein product [Ceutorhynchus assimilis]
MMSEDSSQQDFDLFKQALTDEEDLDVQIVIIQKLESLAKSIGEKLTREELLRFIKRHCIEFHNQILLHLAVQLRSFIPLVGGVGQSKIIFDILEKLCISDENVVREKAVETLIFLQQYFDTSQTEEFILPIIDALIKDDWFASKCSAVTLFSPIYPKLTEEKKPELRNIFINLIQDDSPMVRKATATACISFVEVVEDDFLRSEFILIFQDIAQDPLDLVRIIAIDIAVALIKRLGQDGLAECVFKTIEAACDDSSWKIRQHLANSLASLQQKIPHPKYRGKLIALFQRMSCDFDDEVRIFIATNVFAHCDNLRESYRSQIHQDDNFEPVFETSFMPVIERLALDENESVRLALSSNILPLREILSEECFKKNVVSFLLEVLNLENSTAVHTKFLLVLTSLSDSVNFSESLGAIRNAINTVIKRSKSNWRTRRSILITFTDVAKVCTAEYFADNFKTLYAALLSDSVFAVRRSASLILPILAKHYGMKWASEHLIPYLTDLAQDSRYLYRFVALFGIADLVNSPLRQQNVLLSNFQTIVPDNKNALLSLARINRMNDLIQKKLNEENFLSIIKFQEETSTLESNCDIYVENDLDKLKQTDVFSLEEGDFTGKDSYPYLEGVLYLILAKFLPLVETLFYDLTENIEIKAISTLGEITKFVNKITKELSEEWVQESLKKVEKEDMLRIEEEPSGDFKESNVPIDTFDATPMDDPSLKEGDVPDNNIPKDLEDDNKK